MQSGLDFQQGGLVFRQGGLNFIQGGRDFQQVGLYFSLDIRQVGKQQNHAEGGRLPGHLHRTKVRAMSREAVSEKKLLSLASYLSNEKN